MTQSNLPDYSKTGPVTFLFTDLEDSSRLWDQYPKLMQVDMASHDAILKEGVDANHGAIVKTTGDGIHAAFPVPIDGLNAAIEIQRRVAVHAWQIGWRLLRSLGQPGRPDHVSCQRGAGVVVSRHC